MYPKNFAQATREALDIGPVRMFKYGPSCFAGAINSEDQKCRNFSWLSRNNRVVAPYYMQAPILSNIPDVKEKEPIWPKSCQKAKEEKMTYVRPVFRSLNVQTRHCKKNYESDPSDDFSSDSFSQETYNKFDFSVSGTTNCSSSSFDFTSDSIVSGSPLSLKRELSQTRSPCVSISTTTTEYQSNNSRLNNMSTSSISTNFSAVPSTSSRTGSYMSRSSHHSSSTLPNCSEFLSASCSD